MACKRPIVAPRRETVQQVVENNREALLFEPGDPIDLARKVLRILSEPALGQHLSNAAYDRVRREFTASAARRALQRAYTVIAERFERLVDGGEDDDDSPKVEMLDDDFEATVFEEAPIAAPVVDTALNRIGDPEELADALAQLDSGTSSDQVVAPPPRPSDDTLDRHPVAPGRGDSNAWTMSGLVAAPRSADGDARAGIEIMSPPTPDDWVVTGVVRELTDDLDTGSVAQKLDDGTPADGSPTASPPLTSADENVFVAGEIDVPTPPPEKREPPATVEAHEFIAASSLLGNAETVDPDTGSRTPPLERRNP
jgi:hypothetical protein